MYNNPKIIRVLKSNILVLCDPKFVIRKRSLTSSSKKVMIILQEPSKMLILSGTHRHTEQSLIYLKNAFEKS